MRDVTKSGDAAMNPDIYSPERARLEADSDA